MRMMPIPSGSFMMGSGNGGFDERPVHRVAISISSAWADFISMLE